MEKSRGEAQASSDHEDEAESKSPTIVFQSSFGNLKPWGIPCTQQKIASQFLVF